MKKIITILIMMPLLIMAQAPQGFTYQGVATDNNGFELQNQTISIQASILSSSATGTAVWQETHTTTTDTFGLFNVIIGEGTSTNGGSSATFQEIDWGAAAHFMKVEIDVNGGSNYVHVGTSQMMSVPYALYAKSAGIDSTMLANIISFNTSIPSHGYQYFNNGSGLNTFIVPANAYTLEIELSSGKGGNGGDACNFGYAYGGVGGEGKAFKAIVNCFPGDTIELHIGQDGENGCGACGFGVGCTCVPCGFVSGPGTSGTFSSLIINGTIIIELSPGEFGTGADASNSQQKIHGTDGSSGTIIYYSFFNSSGIFLVSEFDSAAYGKIRW